MIVAISDEPRSKIDEFIKKHGCTYTFLSSREAEKNYGIKAYPTLFLVDPKGKIASGSPQQYFGQCDVPPEAEYSKKFDKALAAVKAGDWKTASTELAKLEKDAGKDGENAQALAKWIEEHGAKKLADADAAKDAGDVIGAKEAYSEVATKWGPKADCVKAAKEKLDELKKDKDAKKALAQEKTYLQAQAAENANDKATAAALYEKCAKAAAGTKFADFCDGKAKALK